MSRGDNSFLSYQVLNVFLRLDKHIPHFKNKTRNVISYFQGRSVLTIDIETINIKSNIFGRLLLTYKTQMHTNIYTQSTYFSFTPF